MGCSHTGRAQRQGMGIKGKGEGLTSQEGSGADKVRGERADNHPPFLISCSSLVSIFPADFTRPFEGDFLFGKAICCPLSEEKGTYLSTVGTHNSFQELTSHCILFQDLHILFSFPAGLIRSTCLQCGSQADARGGSLETEQVRCGQRRGL